MKCQNLISDKRAKMALCRSPDYQIDWTFASGEEVQNRLPRQQPWRHLGFLIGEILVLFIYKSPRWFLPSLESAGLSVQEKKQKKFF